MVCPLCKGKMIKGKIHLPYEMDEEIFLVVRHVPALVCERCGESFVEIEVVRIVEKLLATAKRDGLTFGFIKYREAA